MPTAYVNDGSGRDGYVSPAVHGRYEKPCRMEPKQTDRGMCPRNVPGAQNEAHEHDILSNKVVDNSTLSPTRYRPPSYNEKRGELQPPKVSLPPAQQWTSDRRQPTKLAASPPKRLQTTNQRTEEVTFKGNSPVPQLRETGKISGHTGHKVGGLCGTTA